LFEFLVLVLHAKLQAVKMPKIVAPVSLGWDGPNGRPLVLQKVTDCENRNKAIRGRSDRAKLALDESVSFITWRPFGVAELQQFAILLNRLRIYICFSALAKNIY
jgi:hypothetical protein